MYKNYMHQWKTLAEWQKDFKNEFSLGELYRMAKEGADFQRMLLHESGHLTFES